VCFDFDEGGRVLLATQQVNQGGKVLIKAVVSGCA
jgi:hypothetical protein